MQAHFELEEKYPQFPFFFFFFLTDLEGDRLTNNLYTACKTGNTSKLESLLKDIFSTPLHKPHEKENISESALMSSSNPTDQGSVEVTRVADQSMPVSTGETNELEVHHKMQNQTDKNCSTSSSPKTTKDNVTNEDRTNGKLEERTSSNELGSNIANAKELVLDRLNIAIDVKGSTLLHVAAEAGQRSVLWLLLESGADPSVR